MALRHGFKKEANDYAREFRNELEIPHEGPLSPWDLAEHLCVPIMPLSAMTNVDDKYIERLMVKDRKSFSAVTIFNGNRRLILHNDAHLEVRQASNIAHELAHAILGHPPKPPFDENGCRHWDANLEEGACQINCVSDHRVNSDLEVPTDGYQTRTTRRTFSRLFQA